MSGAWERCWSLVSKNASILAALLVVAGFALRYSEAARTFLHPDEALLLHTAVPASFHDLVWASSEVHHPPLMAFLLHAARAVTGSEIGLRMPIVLAGAMLPFMVFLWLRRRANPGAALIAAAILTFSPSLIALSAQLRAYLPALLFSALALLLFDAALARASAMLMAVFAVVLWLAVLSEYSAAWFALGLGVYAIVRIWRSRPPMALIATWALAQTAAIAIYIALALTVMRGLLEPESKVEHIQGYLSGAFPRAGEGPLAFAASRTLDQFAYLFYAAPAAIPGLALFAAGLWLLWRRGERSTVLLCTIPFAAACAAALIELFPYGRGRHTAILGLFIATGVGVAADAILRSRAGWIAAAATPLAAVLVAIHIAPSLTHLHREVQRRESLLEALDHLKRTVPRGETFLTDRKTAFLLNFYLCGDEMRRPPSVTRFVEMNVCGQYRVFAPEWSIGAPDRLPHFLAAFRNRYPSYQERPVWIFEAGFDVSLLERLRGGPPQAIDQARLFNGAAALFLAKSETR